MALAAYVTLSIIVYASIVVCTWSVVRARLPFFPLLAIVVLVLFPPAFFVIIFYLLMFRLLFWPAFVPVVITQPVPAVVVTEEATPRAMSQAERAAMRK